MHPMKIGLGLALLLHVAAGLSHKAQAKLEAFRAQLEAKEAGAVAQHNPKGKGLIMPGKLPGAGAAAPGRRPHFDESGSIVPSMSGKLPKGKGLIMPGKLPKGKGLIMPGKLPGAGAAAPGRRPHFDETGAVVQDNPKGPQVDIMPGKLPGAGAAAPGAAAPGAAVNLPTSTQDSIMSSTTDEESKPEPQVDIMPGKLPGAGLPTPGLPISDLTTSTQDSIMSSTTDDAHQPQVDIMPGKLPGAVPPGAIPTPGLPDDTSTQDSIMSSTTDDARRSSSTTTAYPMAVDPTVSSTTSAVITPEPKGPQTDSMLGQLVKAAFEKLRSGKGISMIVDVKNLEEFIQS